MITLDRTLVTTLQNNLLKVPNKLLIICYDGVSYFLIFKADSDESRHEPVPISARQHLQNTSLDGHDGTTSKVRNASVSKTIAGSTWNERD